MSTYKRKPSIKKAARKASICEVPNATETKAAAKEAIDAASTTVREALPEKNFGVVVGN